MSWPSSAPTTPAAATPPAPPTGASTATGAWWPPPAAASTSPCAIPIMLDADLALRGRRGHGLFRSLTLVTRAPRLCRTSSPWAARSASADVTFDEVLEVEGHRWLAYDAAQNIVRPAPPCSTSTKMSWTGTSDPRRLDFWPFDEPTSTCPACSPNCAPRCHFARHRRPSPRPSWTACPWSPRFVLSARPSSRPPEGRARPSIPGQELRHPWQNVLYPKAERHRGRRPPRWMPNTQAGHPDPVATDDHHFSETLAVLAMLAAATAEDRALRRVEVHLRRPRRPLPLLRLGLVGAEWSPTTASPSARPARRPRRPLRRWPTGGTLENGDPRRASPPPPRGVASALFFVNSERPVRQINDALMVENRSHGRGTRYNGGAQLGVSSAQGRGRRCHAARCRRAWRGRRGQLSASGGGRSRWRSPSPPPRRASLRLRRRRIAVSPAATGSAPPPSWSTSSPTAPAPRARRRGAWGRMGRAPNAGGMPRRGAVGVAAGPARARRCRPHFRPAIIATASKLHDEVWMGGVLGGDFSVLMDDATRADVAWFAAKHHFSRFRLATPSLLPPSSRTPASGSTPRSCGRSPSPSKVAPATTRWRWSGLGPRAGVRPRRPLPQRCVDLNLARTFYALGNFGRAMEFYGRISRAD